MFFVFLLIFSFFRKPEKLHNWPQGPPSGPPKQQQKQQTQNKGRSPPFHTKSQEFITLPTTLGDPKWPQWAPKDLPAFQNEPPKQPLAHQKEQLIAEISPLSQLAVSQPTPASLPPLGMALGLPPPPKLRLRTAVASCGEMIFGISQFQSLQNIAPQIPPNFPHFCRAPCRFLLNCFH